MVSKTQRGNGSPEQTRRNHIKFIIAIFLLAGVVISCGLCSTAEKISGVNEIEYVVTGTAETVSVTLQNKDDGISQFPNVKLPYKYKMHKAGYCYVSAQNDGKTGSVKVALYKNGSLMKESETTGAHVISTVYETFK